MLLRSHCVPRAFVIEHSFMVECDQKLFLCCVPVLWVQEEAYWVEVLSLAEEVWLSAEANEFHVIYEVF